MLDATKKNMVKIIEDRIEQYEYALTPDELEESPESKAAYNELKHILQLVKTQIKES